MQHSSIILIFFQKYSKNRTIDQNDSSKDNPHLSRTQKQFSNGEAKLDSDKSIPSKVYSIRTNLKATHVPFSRFDTPSSMHAYKKASKSVTNGSKLNITLIWIDSAGAYKSKNGRLRPRIKCKNPNFKTLYYL